MIFSVFGAKNIHFKNHNDFLFTFWPISKQTADVQKNVEGLEWPAINVLRIGYHSFSVTSTVRKPQLKRCFVNKQLTYGMVLLHELPCPPTAKHYLGPLKPLPEYLQRALKTWFDSSAREVWHMYYLIIWIKCCEFRYVIILKHPETSHGNCKIVHQVYKKYLYIKRSTH